MRERLSVRGKCSVYVKNVHFSFHFGMELVFAWLGGNASP